jgi:hypothetical protein
MDKNYLPMGQPLPVRVIKTPGSQAHGIAAVLEPDEGITVEIVEYIVKRIRNLTPEDLVGCSPDAATPELVPWHVALVYDRLPLGENDVVTIWRWRYVEPAP